MGPIGTGAGSGSHPDHAVLRSYRPSTGVRVIGCIFSGIVLLAVLLGVVAAVVDRSWVAVLYLAFGVYCGWVAWRQWRLALLVFDDGLVVRNRWRTIQIERVSIVEFGVGPPRQKLPAGLTIHVRQTSGEVVAIDALEEYFLGRRALDWFTGVVADLERWRRNGSMP